MQIAEVDVTLRNTKPVFSNSFNFLNNNLHQFYFLLLAIDQTASYHECVN